MRRVLCLRKQWGSGFAAGRAVPLPSARLLDKQVLQWLCTTALGVEMTQRVSIKCWQLPPSSGAQATLGQWQTAGPGGRRRGGLELIRTGLIGGWRAAWRVDQ